MYQSEQINELAKSLAAAQAELDPAKKNAQNPHLKNRYADLAAVWEAVREVLPKFGLSIVQTMLPLDGKAGVRTTLMHTSGQWIAGECVLPVPKQDPQGYGSAITYARRYSLSAMIGVVSEDDDDAEGAKKTGQQKQPPAPKQPQFDIDGALFEVSQCQTVDELAAYYNATKGKTWPHTAKFNAAVTARKTELMEVKSAK